MVRRTRNLQTVLTCALHIPAHTCWDLATRTDVLVPAADHRITLRIDLEALALELGSRAAASKGRRAVMKAGAIVATAAPEPQDGSDGHLARALASGD